MKPRDLSGQGGPCADRSGVRASIVALKPGRVVFFGAGEAKGRRKVDDKALDSLKPTQPLFPGLASGELKPESRARPT